MPDATVRGGTLTLAKTAMTGTIVLDSAAVVAAAAAANTVYVFARIPTNARIHGLSRVAFDDLASSGSPTLDFGFRAVGGNFTTDDDALTDGIDVFTAAGTANLVKAIENYGKMVWEYLGLSADPGGEADVIGTIKDAATNTGGDVVLTLVYSTN